MPQEPERKNNIIARPSRKRSGGTEEKGKGRKRKENYWATNHKRQVVHILLNYHRLALRWIHVSRQGNRWAMLRLLIPSNNDKINEVSFAPWYVQQLPECKKACFGWWHWAAICRVYLWSLSTWFPRGAWSFPWFPVLAFISFFAAHSSCASM